MKALKIVGGLVVVAVIVIAIVAVVTLQNIDSIVKGLVEDVGSDVVGTEVRLQEAKIGLTEGRAQLSQLTIANPAGFSNTSAFSLGDIAVTLDLKSLTGGGVIVIEEVMVRDAHLLAEQKNLTDINLQKLLNNVTGGKSGSSTPQEADTASEAGSDVRLAVEKFTLEGTQMRLLTEEWGERTVQLPAIKLNNIGSREQGLTPDQLAEAVMKPLLQQARAAAEKELKDLAQEKAKEKINEELEKNLSEEDAEKVDQLKSLFGR